MRIIQSAELGLGVAIALSRTAKKGKSYISVFQAFRFSKDGASVILAPKPFVSGRVGYDDKVLSSFVDISPLVKNVDCISDIDTFASVNFMKQVHVTKIGDTCMDVVQYKRGTEDDLRGFPSYDLYGWGALKLKIENLSTK